MSFLQSRSDPIATVSSVLPDQYYSCPNIASVDRHIGELSAQLGSEPAQGDPARRKAIRDDIDRLLDRRVYLEMIRQDSPLVRSVRGRSVGAQPCRRTTSGA